MDSSRFRLLMDVVGDALDVPEAAREGWLTARCSDDPDLLTEARSLLSRASGSELEQITRGIEQRVGRAAGWIAAAAFEHPERVGPYEVREVLGEGGMGVVYGAHQEQPLRRDVAVKVLYAGAHTRRVVERFESERRALASLDHPYIARVYDAGTMADGRPYFAMEWVRGLPITEYCDAHRLGVRDRLTLFRKVLDAVQHAHHRSIIHRDLKPSNVMVTEVDGEPTPKVIDFGIARVEPGDAALTTAHTAYGTVLGTIEYMSPEQALSPASGVGTRSDIYSLGVLLYELLTGRLPFPAATLRDASPAQLERLLRDVEPPPPSRRVFDAEGAADRARARASDPDHLERSLRGDLDNIVGMAMRKDPARRYASVANVSDDIGRFLGGRPVDARPSTWSYRTRRFVGRHRWALAGTSAAVVLLSGMTGFFAFRLAAERARARWEAEMAVAFDRFVAPELPASANAGELVGQYFLEASLLGTVGMAPSDLGPGTKFERRLEEALELQRSLNEDTLPDLATRLHEFGVAMVALSDLDRAEEALSGALALRQAAGGGRDAATASTLTSLALLLHARGRYQDAEEAATNALAIDRTDASLRNLAFILSTQGRFDEAETLYREALTVRRRRLYPGHPDLVSMMAELGDVLERRAAYDEAESLFRECFERTRERLGTEHPQTLNALNRLAYMLWRTGHYRRADTLFSTGVAAVRRAFPNGHTALAIMLNNLGVARRRAGDLARARGLHREALEMNRRILGEPHPRIADDMDNLGKVLLLEGDARAAEGLHRQALAMRTVVLGPDHPDLAESLSALADARLAENDTSDAEALLRRALALRKERLGEHSPTVAGDAHGLGVLLASRGEYEEAEQLLQGALAVRRSALDAGHPDIAASLRELGIVFVRTGRYEEAQQALLESRRIAVARLGADDPETHRTDDALVEYRRLTVSSRIR